MIIRDAVPFNNALQIVMVGDNPRNLDRQCASAVAVQQVVEAVVEFRLGKKPDTAATMPIASSHEIVRT
jgi:hypothetical protein